MEEEPKEAAVNKREGRNNAGGLERHDVLYHSYSDEGTNMSDER
jgi:hypothetical protein